MNHPSTELGECWLCGVSNAAIYFIGILLFIFIF
jgi:hypothetical protein